MIIGVLDQIDCAASHRPQKFIALFLQTPSPPVKHSAAEPLTPTPLNITTVPVRGFLVLLYGSLLQHEHWICTFKHFLTLPKK